MRFVTKYEAPQQPPEVEDMYQQRDDVRRETALTQRNIRHHFGHPDHSQPNGRPHHICPWLSGLLTNLGARRNTPSKRFW